MKLRIVNSSVSKSTISMYYFEKESTWKVTLYDVGYPVYIPLHMKIKDFYGVKIYDEEGNTVDTSWIQVKDSEGYTIGIVIYPPKTGTFYIYISGFRYNNERTLSAKFFSSYNYDETLFPAAYIFDIPSILGNRQTSTITKTDEFSTPNLDRIASTVPLSSGRILGSPLFTPPSYSLSRTYESSDTLISRFVDRKMKTVDTNNTTKTTQSSIIDIPLDTNLPTMDRVPSFQQSNEDTNSVIYKHIANLIDSVLDASNPINVSNVHYMGNMSDITAVDSIKFTNINTSPSEANSPNKTTMTALSQATTDSLCVNKDSYTNVVTYPHSTVMTSLVRQLSETSLQSDIFTTRDYSNLLQKSFDIQVNEYNSQMIKTETHRYSFIHSTRNSRLLNIMIDYKEIQTVTMKR